MSLETRLVIHSNNAPLPSLAYSSGALATSESDLSIAFLSSFLLIIATPREGGCIGSHKARGTLPAAARLIGNTV